MLTLAIIITLILFVIAILILYISERYRKQAIQSFTFQDFISHGNHQSVEDQPVEKEQSLSDKVNDFFDGKGSNGKDKDNDNDNHDDGGGDDGGE